MYVLTLVCMVFDGSLVIFFQSMYNLLDFNISSHHHLSRPI